MLYSIRMRAQANQLHISGAEDICSEDALHQQAADLVMRALKHSRGKPDGITINVDRLEVPPRMISSLPVVTCVVEDADQAQYTLRRLLQATGLADGTITQALHLIRCNEPVPGARVLDARSGRPLEPDPHKGIRVSRLGITQQAREQLLAYLHADDNISGLWPRVIEAVVLASKVVSDRAVVAELCIPDNPDYTTGYVASERLGYVRIAHIKHMGDNVGGRVFFVRPELAVDEGLLRDFVHYMERMPVMVDSISAYGGIRRLDEIVGAA
ncbi:MAG: 6-carboxyhexanoate--CoA ligase [Candidatus Magnetobacterium sp. LHC-1]|uniref:6-carboxyhexanoate--CoA ligase n=1 Tax=Candidatus Magnetobacterium casense TaxID=1455061 RepID=A0ABS6RTX1_9BACT|nr:6-carboxyhexanoate--CoA ligase [Candidatus Magnetobacterium casensis]MBF0606125.1 6-carboxyhexanoate--CoA ligase [Nitrospirota bacterium]MBV6340063.1 6-carboxyhexanoate--CoA ligase [Candidatus Magnetobacterium casensis]